MGGVAASQVGQIINETKTWANTILTNANAAIAAINFTPSRTYGGGTDISVGSIGQISLPSLPGSVAIGSSPDMISITTPVLPSEPSFSDPVLGALYDITLPDIPTITFPTVTMTPPVYTVHAPSTWSITTGTIHIMDDPLIQSMWAKLRSNIENGGTGLSAAVEAAIWERDLERNEQTLLDSTDKTTSAWARKGFSLPDGMLAHSLAEVQIEHMNKMLDRSREIAIKQAELEQTNMFKSLEIGQGLTTRVFELLIKMEALAVQAQESTAKFAYDFIDAEIKAYNSQVEGYKAIAQAYEMYIKGELAKIEVYKGQLEGQKIVGEVNAQTVQVYSERQKAVALLIERYKTQVQAMMAEMEVEKAKLEANKIQFDVWAKKAEVLLENYKGQVEVYKAASSVSVSMADVQARIIDAQVRADVGAAQVSVQSIEGLIRSNDLQQSIAVEAMKAKATAAAAMASGAMAALSAHASMGYNESADLIV